MKKVIRIIIIVVIIAAIGVTISHSRKAKKPAPPRTVIAKKGDLQTFVTETGIIMPVDKIDVKSKVAGRLIEVAIHEGDIVKKGQLVAKVDRTLIDPQLERSRAQVAQSQARYQQAIETFRLQERQTNMAIASAEANLKTSKFHLAAVKAGSRPQEIAQQREQVNRAKIVLEDAQRTLNRKKALLAKGFVSQADTDSAQTSVDTAESSLMTAKHQLDLMLAGPRKEDINEAQAQVETARLQLATAKANALQNQVRKSDIDQAVAGVSQSQNDLQQLNVNVADTTIYAPADGIILKTYKEVNEIVQSATTGFSDSQSIIATIGQRLEVRVGINEVDIPRVRIGAPVEVTIDSIPGVSLKGKVKSIAPASTGAFDASSGQNTIPRFQVKVEMDQTDIRLRPGMSANIKIQGDSSKNAVIIPIEGLPFTGLEGDVTVLTSSGKKETKHISIGIRSNIEAEVKSGLQEGDKVIVPITGDRRKLNIGGGPGSD